MHLNSQILAALKTFEAAARLRSFSQAAAELSITPGAVSQQIKNLETQIGTGLFTRKTRQVELTPQGAQLYETARPALLSLDSCLGRIKRSDLEGSVRLRSIPSFVFKWLIPRLGGFQKRFPDIRIETFAEGSLLDLRARDFDIAIDYGVGDYPGLSSTLMMDEYLFPVVSPEYFSAIDWQMDGALNRVPLLHDTAPWANAEPDAEWRYFLDVNGMKDIDTSRGHYFNRGDMAIKAAVAGLGAAIARESLITEEIIRGRLIAPYEKRQCRCSYYIIYPQGALKNPRIKAVHDWLLEIGNQP
ncbi:LysR substrate-binding domain-containing protein [Amphritea balenae]|uniref:LysR family transcriptional regulator n=1 Tax=Amphritea balenae TaxID=452629 RepID=A0A3P1SZ63_9GAMM|nr:LysR substrate-binding domain-containing protein [Amphritea balenae]RRD01413.1 LysR family transcriptional regulator [Amphritea balenae]GGK57317.1 LysR family transcriptional regulator [Amphritea balenae]